MRGALTAITAAATAILALPVVALAESGGPPPGIRDWVTAPVRDLDFARRAVATPDGGVLVAGTVAPSPRTQRPVVVLARLDALGRPVASFGTGGVLGLDLPRSIGAVAAL